MALCICGDKIGITPFLFYLNLYYDNIINFMQIFIYKLTIILILNEYKSKRKKPVFVKDKTTFTNIMFLR